MAFRSSGRARGSPDVGPHGPIVEGLQGRFGEAVKWLRDAKTGDVKGVLSHPELPKRQIDLIHGTEQYGVSHIDTKHPGALDRLPEHWEDLKIQSDTANRTQLRNGEAKAVVSKDFSGEPKDWLLFILQIQGSAQQQEYRWCRCFWPSLSGPADPSECRPLRADHQEDAIPRRISLCPIARLTS